MPGKMEKGPDYDPDDIFDQSESEVAVGLRQLDQVKEKLFSNGYREGLSENDDEVQPSMQAAFDQSYTPAFEASRLLAKVESFLRFTLQLQGGRESALTAKMEEMRAKAIRHQDGLARLLNDPGTADELEAKAKAGKVMAISDMVAFWNDKLKSEIVDLAEFCAQADDLLCEMACGVKLCDL